MKTAKASAFSYAKKVEDLIVNGNGETLNVENAQFMNNGNGECPLKTLYLNRYFTDSNGNDITSAILNTKTGLTDVTFGEQLANVPDLSACTNITTITVLNPNVPVAGGFAGNVYQTAQLIVPEGTEDAFRNAEVWKNFACLKKLDLNIHFGKSTEDGVINLPVRGMLGLRPTVESADGTDYTESATDITVKLTGNGTSKADITCSMYNVNYWNPAGERIKFPELSGHRPTDGNPAKLTVILKVEGTEYSREFTVNVTEPDRTPLENGYTDGTFILNEEWYGHSNGGLNYINEDGDIIYQAYERENPDMAFGATSQAGTVWNDKLIVISKDPADGGDPIPGGGQFVIADAKTLKRIGSIHSLSEAPKVKAFGVAGVTPGKVFVTTGSGVIPVDITDPENPKAGSIIGVTGESGDIDYSKGQTGDIVGARGKAFAVAKGAGLWAIDGNSDRITKIIEDANIQGVTLSADGNVWYATVNDGAARFVCVDPTTLETVETVDMPAETGIVTCSWGAWRPTCFFGLKKKNELWFNTGVSGIAGTTGGAYYRYEIGKDPSSVEKVFGIHQVNENLPDTEFKQATYGSARVDERSGKLIVMTSVKGAASGQYRHHWIHLVDINSGDVSKSIELRPYYWFQSLPIFPDKHSPKVSEDYQGMILDMTESRGAELDLSTIVSDADDIDALINYSLPETDARAVNVASYSLEGTVLTAKPLAAGSEECKVIAESNGRRVQLSIPVTVSTPTGIDGTYGYGENIYAKGNRIHINGFQGKTFRLYNIDGMELAEFTTDSDNYIIESDVQPGIYVIRGAGSAMKVMIK